jgi:hypothetical protein
VEKNFILKLYNLIKRESLDGRKTLRKQAPLRVAGGEAEGLRRKELLYNTATLVPMRDAHILGAGRDCGGFEL